MTQQEIKFIVDKFADITRVLVDADPDDKAYIFRQLGLVVFRDCLRGHEPGKRCDSPGSGNHAPRAREPAPVCQPCPESPGIQLGYDVAGYRSRT
jgi:hypothetical protein